MANVQPLYLNNWVDFLTTIQAAEVRGEFLNIYEALNGNLDASNIRDGSIGTSKLADGAVTDEKIRSVGAGKISGQLTPQQLPPGLLSSSGGEVTGGLVFNTADPLVKTYSNNFLVLFEAGTGQNKMRMVMHPTGPVRFEIIQGSNPTTSLLMIMDDGTLVPRKLRIPVI